MNYSALIDEYEKGGQALTRAVAGLDAEDLKRVPSDPSVGKWTIQQIVIHLMDSDLIGTDRMKRIIAEENPLLVGYDENKFSKRLFYEEQSADAAIALFDVNRRNFTKVLRKLPAEAFERTGIHTETGKVTLGDKVNKYVDHLAHHIKFIRAKREKFGKPIKG
jgi:hypothetical protein